MIDLVIRDVQAVLADGVRHADIEVDGGRIAGIAEPGRGAAARREIEGGGREAFPGVIDPHVHFRLPGSTAVDGDGFEEMTRGAARGGVTSVIAFITAPPEVAGREAVEPFRSQAVAPVDFGIHHVLWPREANLAALDELVEAGVGSFKMFMAYPERGFMFEGEVALAALARVAGLGGLMLVHCEDGNTIRWQDRRARDRLGARAGIMDYFEARPPRLEATSVESVGLWAQATGCRLHLVHISTRDGADAGRRWLEAGVDLSLETCPQYLALDTGTLERFGALAKFAPVLRPREQVDGLWERLLDGTLTILGTDHSGHRGDEKLRIAGQSGIFDVPYGVPGVELFLPLMYTLGVVQRGLPRERLAELLAANAARRFGWFPRKGVLAAGADADITLLDPTERRVVRAADLASRAGYSLYEGMELAGWPSLTLLRGEVTFRDGELESEGGRFLAVPVRAAAAAPTA